MEIKKTFARQLSMGKKNPKLRKYIGFIKPVSNKSWRKNPPTKKDIVGSRINLGTITKGCNGQYIKID